MELTGRVSRILPLQSGEGRNGTWKKQEFIIETANGPVARKVCFTMWGEKIDQFRLTENEEVEVSFDLESREFNNRWYTEAKAWKVARKSAPKPGVPDEEPPPDFSPFPGGDDLPF